MKQVNNKDLLYSTGNYIQYFTNPLAENNLNVYVYIYIYITESLCSTLEMNATL